MPGRTEPLLIDGALRTSSDGRTFPNVNPATEEVIGGTADGTDADLDRAIGAARRAFDELVLDDADLGAALGNASFHITTHAGQGCAVLSRLVLPRARYAEGIEMITGMLRGWPVGDPADLSTLTGPLISERQRRRVLGYIERGRAEGGTIALGGGVPADQPRGFFVEPTVITGVSPGSVVAQEEIFGPVLVVLAHDGDDDAVRIANDSAYGLSGMVFSASAERARAVAERVRTGTISVNGGLYYSPDVPFGGYRQSGTGRESGVAGFEEYLEIKAIAHAV